MKTRISITDDHQLFVDGLSAVLGNSEDLEVVLTTTSGTELIQELDNGAKIDVVFLDLDMPELDGLETLKIIKEKNPEQHVLILSMHHDDAIILHLIEKGANGYLLKNSSVKLLNSAIHGVMENGLYFEDFVVQIMLKGMVVKRRKPVIFNKNQPLSNREMDVLELLCREHTTAEISEKLFISQRTVEGHKKSLLEKTKSRNTIGLIINSLKYGLIQLEDI
ncbi:MAG: response regulator [Crocinitomicaceae bacterium]